MDIDAWPDWANPREIHRLLVETVGPELAATIWLVALGIAVGAAVVHFIMVPLGLCRRPGGRR